MSFHRFQPEEWMDKISADLKGADFNKRLVWKTSEGFDVMPFYRREDLESLQPVDFFLPLFLREDVAGECREKRVQGIPDGRFRIPGS